MFISLKKRENVRLRDLIIGLVLFLPLNLFSQVTVEANLDSAKIVVGQQTDLCVTVTAKEGAKITFPFYEEQQEIIPGVEVVESHGDTLSAETGIQTIKRFYSLTSWAERAYDIPPLEVKVDGKTFKTKSLKLDVGTIEVDTLHPEKIRPAKDIMDNPFSWAEWLPVILLTLLAVILLGLAYWLVHRLRQNKPVLRHLPFIKHLLPHQKALMEIERIKADQLSTSEDQKMYYTRLTDTLRQYLEDRFGFKAKEMTSGEIIQRLQQEDSTKISELRMLFETADLVKFAKYSTSTNENEMYLTNVVRFIDETKMDEQVDIVDKEQETVSDSNNQSRRIGKLMVFVLILSALVVLTYVGWIVYVLTM